MTTEYNLAREPAARWVQSSLREGPSLTFAKRVAETAEWGTAVFKTYANDGLSSKELTDFSIGGKVAGLLADRWIMDVLAGSSMTENGLFLVEDWRATPRSEFLGKMSLPTFFVGEEVYYIVRERDLRGVPHWRRIFSNTVPAFHAFLLDDDPRFKAGGTGTGDLLRETASRVRAVISGAYDGEGYILATLRDAGSDARRTQGPS